MLWARLSDTSYLQVSCAVQRRTSRRSKPNWDLVRKSNEYQSPTPAPSDNGSSYGSSYEPSYGNGNGSSSSYSPPAPAYSPPEPEPAPAPPPREVRVDPQSLRRSSSSKNKSQKGRWSGMDAGRDQSDDQVRLQMACTLAEVTLRARVALFKLMTQPHLPPIC